MAKAGTGQRLWVCPACGSGRRAPSRPRRDDIRRYCFECSTAAGRLIERACPALERKRRLASEKRRERATRQRARDARTREARQKRDRDQKAADEAFIVGGLRPHQELIRLTRLTAFGGPRGALARHVPELRIRRTSRAPRYGSMIHLEQRWIRVVDWPELTAESVAVSLLWSLSTFHPDGDDRWAYNRAFIRAFEEAWPGVEWDSCPQGRPLVDISRRDLADCATRSLSRHFRKERLRRTQARVARFLPAVA